MKPHYQNLSGFFIIGSAAPTGKTAFEQFQSLLAAGKKYDKAYFNADGYIDLSLWNADGSFNKAAFEKKTSAKVQPGGVTDFVSKLLPDEFSTTGNGIADNLTPQGGTTAQTGVGNFLTKPVTVLGRNFPVWAIGATALGVGVVGYLALSK